MFRNPARQDANTTPANPRPPSAARKVGGVLLVAAAVAMAATAVWFAARRGDAFPARYAGRTADVWLERAGSGDPRVREEAVTVLSGEVVPGLVKALRSRGGDSGIREAVAALANVVPGLGISLPTAAERQAAAARELGILGSHARPAVDALLETLASPGANPTVRAAAAAALGRIRAEPDRVIPRLLNALRDPESDTDLRAQAAFALASYGPAASNATPVLLLLLDAPKDSKDLWTSVRFALKEIAPEAAARAGIR